MITTPVSTFITYFASYIPCPHFASYLAHSLVSQTNVAFKSEAQQWDSAVGLRLRICPVCILDLRAITPSVPSDLGAITPSAPSAPPQAALVRRQAALMVRDIKSAADAYCQAVNAAAAATAAAVAAASPVPAAVPLLREVRAGAEDVPAGDRADSEVGGNVEKGVLVGSGLGAAAVPPSLSSSAAAAADSAAVDSSQEGREEEEGGGDWIDVDHPFSSANVLSALTAARESASVSLHESYR